MADEGAQKRIDIYLASTITILWYICWPLYYIATGVLYILKLLYWPVDFLLQPFVYLGRFLFACCLAPFQLLVKLEVRTSWSSVVLLPWSNLLNRWSTSTSESRQLLVSPLVSPLLSSTARLRPLLDLTLPPAVPNFARQRSIANPSADERRLLSSHSRLSVPPHRRFGFRETKSCLVTSVRATAHARVDVTRVF